MEVERKGVNIGMVPTQKTVLGSFNITASKIVNNNKIILSNLKYNTQTVTPFIYSKIFNQLY